MAVVGQVDGHRQTLPPPFTMKGQTLFINPQRAYAARVTVAVCVSTLIVALQATTPAALELRQPENKGDFPETTAFKRYYA